MLKDGSTTVPCRIAVLALHALLGCSGDSTATGTDDTGETGTAEETGTTGPVEGAPTCLPQPVCDEPTVGFAQDCTGSSTSCEPGCASQEELVIGAPWECLLTTLRDRQPAQVPRIQVVDYALAPTVCGFEWTIRSLGDGTAYLQSLQFLGSMSTTTHSRVQLKPPEFFDDCLQATDTAVIADCLVNWYEPDMVIEGACCPVSNEEGLPPC